MRIWIDGDACPRDVREIVLRASRKHRIPLRVVANRPAVGLPALAWIDSVVVSAELDAADAWIASHMASGDLVITQDLPLAADVVAREGVALTPRGELLTERNIHERLAIRDLMTEVRASGLETGGPPPFDERARKAFAATFDRWLTAARKAQPRCPEHVLDRRATMRGTGRSGAAPIAQPSSSTHKESIMATTAFKGTPAHTSGNLPQVGQAAPAFALVDQGLATKSLGDFPGVRILSIFPSVDTGVCAMSVRQFNERAASAPGVSILNISADLPFAAKRFCGAEGISGAHTLSTFRSTFGHDYGTTLTDSPLAGLNARAVLVVDSSDTVRYVELVPEITQEPDYEAALAAAHAAN